MLRLGHRILPRAASARAFHTAIADFINYGPSGDLVTNKVSIRIGDPDEAYVLIPPEVGRALTSSSARPTDSGKAALRFFHDTQHFAQVQKASAGYPRLVIPQKLPRHSAATTCPATLFLQGKLHMIALNGTFDAEFGELQSTIGSELGTALEKLKDM